MDIKEIIEGNKLIGNFMGWKEYWAYEIKDQWEIGDRCGGKEYNNVWILNPTSLFIKHKCYGLNIEEDEFENKKLYDDWTYGLRFDSSWEWLMPVVAKISQELPEWTYEKWEFISYNKIDAENAFYNNNKEEVYQAVVEFIKWYNEQKTNSTRSS